MAAHGLKHYCGSCNKPKWQMAVFTFRYISGRGKESTAKKQKHGLNLPNIYLKNISVYPAMDSDKQ